LLEELSENEIQRHVFLHLRTRGAPGILPFHPKNASADMRGRKAGIHVGLGILPGIPDIIIIEYATALTKEVSLCRVYALELKRQSRKGKKQTEHERRQELTRDWMAAVGVTTGVAFGLDDALQQLEKWGLLRGAVS
jgi:hypothetical protein